jgi:hypothetical protein
MNHYLQDYIKLSNKRLNCILFSKTSQKNGLKWDKKDPSFSYEAVKAVTGNNVPRTRVQSTLVALLFHRNGHGKDIFPPFSVYPLPSCTTAHHINGFSLVKTSPGSEMMVC